MSDAQRVGRDSVLFSGVMTLVLVHGVAAQSFVDRAERMAKSLERLPRHVVSAKRFSIEQEMARLHVTGASIAVVADGRLVWARGFGRKEAGQAALVDTSTLFLAGSISKPVFATGALALVENGSLSLDGDVDSLLHSWHLPASRFTRTEKVTLRRLLSHTAGLTVWGFRGYRPGAPLPTVPQLLDGAPPANTPAVRSDTTPGSRWLYSGGGFTVAQLLATDVTGEPFPALMRRLVLARADMTHSTFENPLPTERIAEAATGHEPGNTPVVGRWKVYPEMAAAGLWTTASDLARWAIALARSYRGEASGLLSIRMAGEMLRPQAALPKTGPGGRSSGGSWGLGIEIAEQGKDFNFTHSGKDAGFVSTLLFFPERNVGLVVLTNSSDLSFLAEVTRAFVEEFVR